MLAFLAAEAAFFLSRKNIKRPDPVTVYHGCPLSKPCPADVDRRFAAEATCGDKSCRGNKKRLRG